MNYSDPEKGPVCQNCWLNLGQDLEDLELEEKKGKQDLVRRKKKDQDE